MLPTESAACAAVVARSLLDGPFLDRLTVDPDGAMADMALPPEVRDGLGSIDTQRLGLVAAFVCKVKHNDLWKDLPLTRRILRERGAELEFFARYARHAPPNVDRVAEFVEFLTAHLDESGGRDDVVGDVARHELIVHRLRSAPEAPPAVGHRAIDGGHEWRPQVAAAVAIGAFRHDPASFMDDTSTMASASGSPEGSVDPTFVAYRWNAASSELGLFRIDPLTALVLSAADGARTIDEIGEQVRVADADQVAVEAALDEAARRGLIEPPPPMAAAEPGAEPDTDEIVGLFEGYFAVRALHSLHRTGVLEELATPRTAEQIGGSLGLDPVWLGPVLTFVAGRTTVVEQLDDGRYRAPTRSYEELGFLIDKFVGAYGPCLDLDRPSPEAVDGSILAGAFERVTTERRASTHGPSTTTLLLEQLGVATDVVDLGCGSGGVLHELAARDPAFRGIGVDQNPSMCAAARTSLADTGLDRRVEIYEGDAVAMLAALPSSRRETVTALHGRSFFNACFGSGIDAAGAVVGEIRRAFPGRLLLVDDYYGELSADDAEVAVGSRRWAAIQDVVQAWSGQGVPPADRRAWAVVYALGGARLLHAYEDEIDGFRRFIHVVRLGEDAWP